MAKEGYMTGNQLRQYLHISTRKLKFLMDNDYIPHENTGHPTHKYLVKIEDAEAFNKRQHTDKKVGRNIIRYRKLKYPKKRSADIGDSSRNDSKPNRKRYR